MSDNEQVGSSFSLDKMNFSRKKAWEAVNDIATSITPGMTENQALTCAENVLNKMKIDRIWHPTKIRFGSNTVKSFNELSDSEITLGDDDIYFIDIGPVWSGHEGDAGSTFTTGDDKIMNACKRDVKIIFDVVSEKWRTQHFSGQSLYDFAAAESKKLGWNFNLNMKGHRIGDFPHAIYKAPKLADYDNRPSSGLWVLEIQISHPTLKIGAFYEDILIQ
jgi:hypothetical protein